MTCNGRKRIFNAKVKVIRGRFCKFLLAKLRIMVKSPIGLRALADLYDLSMTKTLTEFTDLASELKNVYLPLEVNQISTWTFPVSRVDKIADNLLPEHYKQEDVKPIQNHSRWQLPI